VPLVLRGPGIARGKARDDLVEHIDIAATSLVLAGIGVPRTMQGHDVLAPGGVARDAVFAARDRCDETVERIRSVRTVRFKYIRNFYPDRPHLQPNCYKDGKAIVRRLRELHAQGRLDALPEQLLFAPKRPKEELYDVQSDPDEVRDLAADPAHHSTLEELRGRLDRWTLETGDRGQRPESSAMYDSDMDVYLEDMNDSQGAVLRKNIALMKQWAALGK
jgi:arylsulfatase A-like enzyme